MIASCAGITLELNEKTLAFSVLAGSEGWNWEESYRPYILMESGEEIPFAAAEEVIHSMWITGVGKGIRSQFKHLPNGMSFETIVWIEEAARDLYFEWIPVEEGREKVRAVYWPGPMAFAENSDRWYTVLNMGQGVLLPNTWKEPVNKLHFEGQMCSCAAYMPWFGQVRPGGGYIAICQQPWDAAYQVDHPAEGPYTHVSMRWLPSLGKMHYRRTVRMTFLAGCDYNDLCKVYRAYAKETGLLVTLREKAARNPLVDKLIGSAIVHKGIKTHVNPGTLFYDAEHPERNDHLVSFEKRREEILNYYDKGLRKLYLHLDGWGDPGYDNCHPDYLPACQAAGGWEGLKALSDTIEDCGFMFGLHDQYRDYYFDAPTFDEEFAARAPDGSILDVSRWAGGRQSYLCASQAPYYVKRNFEEVLSHGIHLEASYLDVFTCNEGDECDNPRHRMTRKECFAYREQCFQYLLSRDILPSSEECTDWAMRSLVFCHYGPYEFMLKAPGSPRAGVPVPLFNLCYHDCMILPWLMDHEPGQEDYMLYALLNGGAAYMDKDGAYPGCDGSFHDEDKILEEEIRRYRIVAALQEQVAKQEMVRHEFLSGDPMHQKTTFADGTTVEIDLTKGTYQIEHA